ncbi:hypothetical protein [Pseudomonas costantinii]|uniref:Uncharacterized protein n=1 Tax=Pseudomonas costantinii TaxID=168469 RepID=A0A1S2UEF8_9PSED|nr:hypothetical protein [Pseudomonas costantinii]OIN44540.1 hypothetical protein BFL40_30090 [Pseudomonas costantinii]SED27189.1 hypothetical protein SAMN04515675_0512 [Pseudomonas costantinii]
MTDKSLFRAKKDLVVKVFLLDDGDDPFICAVNGEIGLHGLTMIEEQLSWDHEFSRGPGEYIYEAAYDDGQYDEMGRCEIRPFWELTEISFEKHPEPDASIDGCAKCGVTDISCLCCIPF